MNLNATIATHPRLYVVIEHNWPISGILSVACGGMHTVGKHAQWVSMARAWSKARDVGTSHFRTLIEHVWHDMPAFRTHLREQAPTQSGEDGRMRAL